MYNVDMCRLARLFAALSLISRNVCYGQSPNLITGPVNGIQYHSSNGGVGLAQQPQPVRENHQDDNLSKTSTISRSSLPNANPAHLGLPSEQFHYGTKDIDPQVIAKLTLVSSSTNNL